MRRRNKPQTHKVHESTIEKLVNRLEKSNHEILVHHEYPLGEIDVMAIKDNNYLFFEIKSRDHYKSRNKANDQLSRMREHYKHHGNIYTFYVTPNKIKWIK